MIEKIILSYVVENLPSLVTGVVIAAATYKLQSYELRLKKLENRLAKQINVCIEDDPLRAKRLLGDD